MQNLLIETVIAVVVLLLLWSLGHGRLDMGLGVLGRLPSHDPAKDFSERESMVAQLTYQLRHDLLTGLPNRETFLRRLDEIYSSAVHDGVACAVLVLHVDRLERINENFGYAVGDALLKEITNLLRSHLGSHDAIGRTGSREFTIALGSLSNAEAAEAIAKQMLQSFDEPIAVGEHSIVVSPAIGFAAFPADCDDAFTLVRDAARAQSRTKVRGAGNLVRLSRRLSLEAEQECRIESLIQHALVQGGFEVHYQPISDIHGELCALEALLRLNDGFGKFVSPSLFIPIAESSGNIVRVGRWVLREVCRQVKQWQLEGLKVVPVAINASSLQIVQSSFCSDVLSILKEFGVAPELVNLELTESGVMPKDSLALDNMLRLSAEGIRFSIDDFGTGFSSLDRLHRLPVSVLKIDQTFVARMLDLNGTLPIVATIISMAHSLNLGVVAEGVESHEQFCALYEMGCDQFQGYFLGRPVDASAASLLFSPTQRVLLSGQILSTSKRLSAAKLGSPLC
jgi:diguanylate cyclase (GGDEF)-like protein